MMNKNFFLLAVLFATFVKAQKIEGDYFSINTECKIHLKIDTKNYFSFEINKEKDSGIAKIFKEKDVIYIDFNNISTLYENDTIIIQNYGNSMNPYLYFKECDEKFIRLAKKNKTKVLNFEKEYSILLKSKNLANYTCSYSIQDLEILIKNTPIDKTNIEKYNDLAYFISKMKNGHPQAIYILQKVLEKFPDRVVAYLNLADSYWAINNQVLAKENYKKYINLMKSQKKDLAKIPQRVYDRIK